eukprot:m.357859 g.357859  ORF g.357859 m.357859 type:complete len:80 (-) comp17959_c0_seq1:313-552(-)
MIVATPSLRSTHWTCWHTIIAANLTSAFVSLYTARLDQKKQYIHTLTTHVRFIRFSTALASCLCGCKIEWLNAFVPFQL